MIIFKVILFVIVGVLNPAEDGGFFGMFDHYSLVYYAVDYSNGLLTRALAGELFGEALLSLGLQLPIWATVIKTVYTLVFYAFLWLLIKKYYNTDIKFAAMISIMFMRMLYLNSAGMYVIKTDIFWYACMIPIILLLWSDTEKHFNFKMIGVILSSGIAMLFHHSFIFVFAPLVCAFLIDKKRYKWFVGYGVFMIAVFLYLAKFCTGDYQAICNQVMTRFSDAGILTSIESLPNVMHAEDGNFSGLYYEYGDSRLTQIYESELLRDLYFDYHLPICCIQLAIGCASVYLVFKILKIYFKDVLHSKWQSQILTLVFILPFIALAFFTIDIDRWALMTLTSLDIFAIYVCQKYNIRVNVNPKLVYTSFGVQMAAYFITSVLS